MMMISDLPRDIVEEILTRLPLKSMRAVRLTCKNWNALSKSRSFSKMQIGKEEVTTKEGESQVIVMKDDKLYLMSVVNNGDPYVEIKSKFTCITGHDNISQVYNCEGLLLCKFTCITGYDNISQVYNTRLMVWNPYCLKTRWMQTRCYMEPDWSCYFLGYSKKMKNKSCSHKILRFVNNTHIRPGVKFFKKVSFWCEIYNFESDSWRNVHVSPHWSIKFYNSGVSIKGNTYFCTTKSTAFANHIYIICFDFTRERFRPPILLPFATRYIHKVTLSCVKEEKLAALVRDNDRTIANDLEIWITTEIEPKKLIWSKFFTVNIGPEISCRFKTFIIDEEKKLVINFHDKITILGEFGYYTELDLFEEAEISFRRQYFGAYVPSLVKIKQGARGKRIKKENAEKRRGDEKMLRLDSREKRTKKQSA